MIVTLDTEALDTLTAKEAQALIAADITTPELLANLIASAELVEECLVLEPRTWHVTDGYAEIEIEADSGEEAAQEYVDDGDWASGDTTTWVEVIYWREGIDDCGEIVRLNRGSEQFAFQPREPRCIDGEEHDWQSPREIVGGIKENPGVWGHGGGVIITECCLRCGCERTIDTWAQNPSNGEQGLRSVSYEPEKYAEKIQAMREASE